MPLSSFFHHIAHPIATYKQLVRVTKASAQWLTGAMGSARSALKKNLPDTPAGWLLAYVHNVWVRRCINLRGACVTTATLRLMLELPDGTTEEVTEHDALAPLQAINSDDKSGSQLWNKTEVDTQVYGDAIWYLERYDQKQPQEVIRLDPRRVKAVPSKEEGVFVEYYEYTPSASSSVVYQYPPGSIVRFYTPNPDNPYVALSPTQSVMPQVNQFMATTFWNSVFFRNNARTDGFITVPEDTDPEDKELIRKVMEEAHGGEEKAHRIGVLGGDAKWVSTGTVPKDTDWQVSDSRSRDATCAGYGTPVFLVSGHDATNFATAKEQRSSYWEDTIIPQLAWYAEQLTTQYLPHFDDTEGLFFVFDTSDIPAMQEVELTRTERLQKAVGTPIMTINEARKQLGLDPVDGGDVIRAELRMLPINGAAEAMANENASGS